MMGDFKLSASLTGHEDDVRAVAFPSPEVVLSASRDATVRIWKVISSKPPKFDGTVSSHGTAFINTLAYMRPTEKYPEGLIISGGKDTICEVRRPNTTASENAEALLLGHSHNVCALDVDVDGRYIVSGGWDAQARVWMIGKWECEVVLEGHEGSVWAVLAFDAKTIITGCADKAIRVFDVSGKLLRTIKGSTDVVRALCRLPKGHSSGADFASAGNDGSIRFWKMNGTQLGELNGHESYIYSLVTLPTGEMVSSGEDRTVRVWKDGECIQSITHPAISVWGVAACTESGDIVTGASDRIVRVFTRSADRVADPETIRNYEESVKASAIPQQQLPQVNKEKLPGPEFLQQKAGTKEGQVQMILETNGSVTAHQWSAGQQQWISVGTVVDSVGSSGRKVEYRGKEYDYVFDVDIEDGKPPLKLPYNLSQNPYEAATKFIEDNKLPMTYLDTVANFITTNSQGSAIGQSDNQGPPPAGYDPWGSESRYRPADSQAPVQAPPTAPKVLPQKTYLSILVARYDSMQKKIEELNQALISNGRKDVSLNPTELAVLAELRAHLESQAGAPPPPPAPSSSSSSSSQQPVPARAAPPRGGLDLAVKLSALWPYGDRLPGLDLLRLLAGAPQTAAYAHPRLGGDIVQLLVRSVGERQPADARHAMMAVRALANLFASGPGRALARRRFGEARRLVAGALEADAAAAPPRRAPDRNLLVAATTLYINYAVLFASRAAGEGAAAAPDPAEHDDDDDDDFEHALELLRPLSSIVEGQSDSEVVYRALVAAGTLLLGLGEEMVAAARDVYGLDKSVEAAARKATDPRIKSVARELRALMK